jgi:ribonuclease VapC
MIVDSSVVVAIIKQESDAGDFADQIEFAVNCRMSTATFFETAIVIDSKRSPLLSARLDDLCADADIEFVAVDEAQARIARQAYRDFGKGSGHPARLNFGDCFAYALAKALDEPLLYKGTDFSHTDVRLAVP